MKYKMNANESGKSPLPDNIPPPFSAKMEEDYPWLKRWRENPIFLAFYEREKRHGLKSNFQKLDVRSTIVLWPLVLMIVALFIAGQTLLLPIILFYIVIQILTVVYFYPELLNIDPPGNPKKLPLTIEDGIHELLKGKDDQLSIIPMTRREIADAYTLNKFRGYEEQILVFYLVIFILLLIPLFITYHSDRIQLFIFAALYLTTSLLWYNFLRPVILCITLSQHMMSKKNVW